MSVVRTSGVVIGLLTSVAAGCSRDIGPDVAAAVMRIVGEAPAETKRSGTSDLVRADVHRFYTQRGGAPAWVTSDAKPGAADVLAIIRTAPNHGFASADYDERELARVIEAKDGIQALKQDAEALARLDVQLTTALVMLGRDVALGRSTPAAIDKNWKARRTPPDLAGTLAAAAGTGDLAAWLDDVRPAHPEYAALQRTLTAMNDRQRQDGSRDPRATRIALNLERWRWMPDDFGARHVLVNVPAYYMAARENGMPVLEMKVIVGTPEHATPIFSDEMETVVFSPYWNVPESIAEGETAPAAARDPGYLQRQNIEVLRRTGSGTEHVDPASVKWDDPDAIKELTFRQKPGARNALGHVKFLFPNAFSVYLHDTPADSLFARSGRAFSHGCIRVEHPEALAAYLLRDQSEWSEQRIKKAMYSGDETPVAMGEKVPVHIVYFTAWPKGDGDVELFDDIYGYDTVQSSKSRAAGDSLMSRR